MVPCYVQGFNIFQSFEGLMAFICFHIFHDYFMTISYGFSDVYCRLHGFWLWLPRVVLCSLDHSPRSWPLKLGQTWVMWIAWCSGMGSWRVTAANPNGLRTRDDPGVCSFIGRWWCVLDNCLTFLGLLSFFLSNSRGSPNLIHRTWCPGPP